MNATRIIECKRDGRPLSESQIAFLIDGYVDGRVPDYQMAAFAMAVYFQGMDDTETAALTQRMLRSGSSLAWDQGSLPNVDKHSTGGIGDKTSLLLAPLLACCGVQVPMISGRGLGATGGTLDKLESIPGFRTDLSRHEIEDQAQRIGCVISGATADIAPADKRLYALRDVTATVPSVALITASIMSKKLAESLDALVLDVKFGSGAFMKTPRAARELAKSLVATGQRMGVSTTALLTDMNQPLGRMVGNAVEVAETLDCLRGEGPPDVLELTLALAAELLVMTRVAEAAEADSILRGQLASGRAHQKFREMVVAQGGDADAPLNIAPRQTYRAGSGGCVTAIDAQRLGEAVIHLGGGRRQVDDVIDHSVGLEILVRLGDPVEPGQPLTHVFSPQPLDDELRRLLQAAFTIGTDRVEPTLLVRERIGP